MFHSEESPTTVDHFLFSPASSYPKPFARLIDRDGRTIHTWSNEAAQPPMDAEPPSFLRGWNHVEVDAVGNLYAMVPLRALLKIAPDSSLLWQADIAVHHDLAFGPDGKVHVLTEEPRQVRLGSQFLVILDNAVTTLATDGTLRGSVSLFDVLCTDPVIAADLRDRIVDKHTAFTLGGHRINAEARGLLASVTYGGSPTEALRILRGLPGSPCDALHTNTIEILPAHPKGLWEAGHVLLSFRNLDLVAVVDLDTPQVLWSWGPGELSGQHQPSALPNGNLLIFDNGRASGRSRVVEVDPATRRIIWEYAGKPAEPFFTELAGGCERLPNDNVLVTEAEKGRAFEVTRDEQVVWEWSTAKEHTGQPTSRVTLYRLAGVPASTAALLSRAEAS
ncbi:arylsulfotransferase family protein [Streptomyces sp. NPDC048560]|uniref:arylsulfotransferase family protein n=1 Tax=Streptomyces sp. NPDC048560 TaxID=3155488 RepID=UPI00341E69B5